MQRKFLYDDFESGKCFLVEYIGGSEPQLIQRGALIAAVLDPTPAEKEKVGA